MPNAARPFDIAMIRKVRVHGSHIPIVVHNKRCQDQSGEAADVHQILRDWNVLNIPCLVYQRTSVMIR